MRKKTDSNEAHRERAIAKLRTELNKDISRAVNVAKCFGLWELLRLCYVLRMNRVIMTIPHYREKVTPAEMRLFHLYDESLKYAISLSAQHGKWRQGAPEGDPLVNFDNDLVLFLDEICRHINGKYETEMLLHIADVRVSGERDQDCQVNLVADINSPERAMYLQYGLRIERFASEMKNNSLKVDALIRKLRDDYSDIADLFAADFGISLASYCEGMLALNTLFVERATQAEMALPLNAEGLIEPLQARTFVAMAKTMIFTDTQLNTALSNEFVDYIRKHPFDANDASHSELRFHYLTRRPFLLGNGFFVISPDLIFDSVLDNTHYTLLESEASKAAYKNRRAAQFIDKIAQVALPFGYEEVGRDIYLQQGKKSIGDIDLHLHNKQTAHTILVEGKNHTLPLAVYFRSPEAIKDHVSRTKDWEKKVQRRIEHIHGDKSSYPVADPWDYVVVTQMPEPLAHLSNLMILSIHEFEKWLQQAPRSISFDDFFHAIYGPSSFEMSESDVETLMESGFVLLRPPA